MAPGALPHTDAAIPSTFSAALHQLRTAQKSGKGAPPYSLYVNRPVGRVLAAAAHTCGLTPNQVTAVSAMFSLAAIILIASGPLSWWTGLVVSLLLAFGYALDSADGQLARLRGGGSLAGEWLDHVIDAAKVSALHLAVLTSALQNDPFSDRPWTLAVPMVFAVVAAVHFFGMVLVDLLHRERRAQLGQSSPPIAPSQGLKTWLKAPTDYGILCWSFVLLGAPAVFGSVYGLLALASTGYLALILRKWYREVVALDQQVSS